MHRRQKWTRWYDDFGGRACVPQPACPVITGPIFFAVVAQIATGASVRFKFPDHFVEKSNLGVRRTMKKSLKSKGTIRFDEQYRYHVDVGYVTARQRSLEVAMAVDEECMVLGIYCLPTGVASWGDD